MAFEDDSDDRDRKRRAAPAADDENIRHSRPPASRAKGRTAAPGVGNALRAAYQETLREEVPPEMLDLLGKLG